MLQARLSRSGRARRLFSAGASIVGHGLLTVAIAFAPAWAARQKEPLEFVAVKIVPVQALGVPEPQPVPPAEPSPQQALPEPEKEDSTEEPDQRLPDPEPTETAPPPQQRPAESTGVDRSPAEPVDSRTQRRGSPTGDPLSTSPFGAAVAGFDNPDFVYNYYVQQMLAMIGSHWNRPSVGKNVELTIHYRIERDGTLTEIEIVAPSGSDVFDLAGLRAVRLASPLPPLPASYPHDSLGVNLIIR